MPLFLLLLLLSFCANFYDYVSNARNVSASLFDSFYA
jgi:hypothetical protein